MFKNPIYFVVPRSETLIVKIRFVFHHVHASSVNFLTTLLTRKFILFLQRF